MRAFFAALGAIATLAGAAPAQAGAQPAPTAQRALAKALKRGMAQAGSSSGAYVVDLTTGQALFSSAANVKRLPASVEKLYTTSTALMRFGPDATLTTSVFGQGVLGSLGTWSGTLYLRGGGDPTFGSASFDRYAYGRGATMQRLVANLLRRSGITAVKGRVVGDGSYFDSLRGTLATSFQFSPYLEGSLSAIAYNRGLLNNGSGYVLHPAVFAARQFVSAMRAARVKVPTRTLIAAGTTPPGARQLATVNSPRIATLIQLTNAPSDNFFAEMLLKAIGSQFGGAGTTAAGAAVVRAELASKLGIQPQLDDGSGLSRDDATSPRQVVTLLSQMATDSSFQRSLAVAGETGTLQDEMNGTIAQGRCRGKTGTLHDVSNLVGYCQAQDGHMLAFAFLMNSIDPSYAHPIQNGMAVALAKYDG
jgi:serine-type D-Ala-D-Ala carboxypeptidase/endopeptidase (penicillin-binding protein 4)